MIGDRRFAAIACALAITPVAVNVAAGGLDYKPTASGNPCDSRTWAPTHSLDDVLSQAALSALDHLSKADIDDAAKAGLNRAVDDGENSGRINAVEAFALRLAVRGVPVDRLLQLVRDHLYG